MLIGVYFNMILFGVSHFFPCMRSEITILDNLQLGPAQSSASKSMFSIQLKVIPPLIDAFLLSKLQGVSPLSGSSLRATSSHSHSGHAYSDALWIKCLVSEYPEDEELLLIDGARWHTYS